MSFQKFGTFRRISSTTFKVIYRKSDQFYNNLKIDKSNCDNCFIRLLLALLMLEHQVNIQKGELDSGTKDTNSTQSGESINSILGGSLSSRQNQFKYITGAVIPQQPMFLNAIIIALKLVNCNLCES